MSLHTLSFDAEIVGQNNAIVLSAKQQYQFISRIKMMIIIITVSEVHNQSTSNQKRVAEGSRGKYIKSSCNACGGMCTYVSSSQNHEIIE